MKEIGLRDHNPRGEEGTFPMLFLTNGSGEAPDGPRGLCLAKGKLNLGGAVAQIPWGLGL